MSFKLKIRPLREFASKDVLSTESNRVRADFIARGRIIDPSQEGFFDNFRDSHNANRAASISHTAIRKLGETFAKQNDQFFTELSQMKTIGNFWDRDQIVRYMTELPKTATDLNNRIIPLFQKYFKAKPDSEAESKLVFEATQFFEKSIANKSGPYNYLAGFAGYNWICQYNRNEAITYQDPEPKGQPFSACGFQKKADFEVVPKWWTSNFDKSFYEGMNKFNELVCDIVEQKEKGEYYSDLPDGLYKVWMLFDHTICWQGFLSIHPEMVGAVMKMAAFVERKLGVKLLTY